jgi:3-deoxy-D-manno-octulosonate 8-phosphate phosphatase KdsC-like HAD superfamily phosphatase
MTEQKLYQGWTILVDCDGVLTDGKKYVDHLGGRQVIAFHSRDSIACEALIEMGFKVIILTHSFFDGIRNYWEPRGAKVHATKLEKSNVHSHFYIDPNKVIGIGDDITDNSFLETVKFPYIVADAHPHYNSKELELWLGRSVYLGSGKAGSPKKLPCKGGEGVLAYIYQLVKLGVYAGE